MKATAGSFVSGGNANSCFNRSVVHENCLRIPCRATANSQKFQYRVVVMRKCLKKFKEYAEYLEI